MSYRPRARDELVMFPVGLGEDESVQLQVHDPLIGRRVVLGPVTSHIVPLCDGAHPLDEILATATAAAAGLEQEGEPLPPERIAEHALRSLLLMNLVEGAGDGIATRVREARAGAADYPNLVLPESRFACQGSSDCCRNYVLGPIEEADAARLQALELRAAFPRLAGGPLFDERPHDTGKDVFLRKGPDDRCVFLDDDLRCGLHRRFGAESKPSMCQLYPIHVLPTYEGLRVYDGGECTRFSTSARSGDPLAEVARRLGEVGPRVLTLFHPVVMLEHRHACDYAYVLGLQDVLVDLVERRAAGPAETLAAVARTTRSWLAALTACPLAPGEPAATMAAWRDDMHASSTSDPGVHACSPGALETLAALAGELASAVRHPPPDALHPGLGFAALAEETAGTAETIAALARGADDAEASRVLAIADGAELAAFHRLSLRQQLFGGRALIDQRLMPGLARIGFATLGTIVAARRRARRRLGGVALADDFDAGHSTLRRVLSTSDACGMFLAHGPGGLDLLEACATIAARLAPATA